MAHCSGAAVLSVLVLAMGSDSAQCGVAVKGLEEDGLRLVPADAPDFTRMVQRTVGRTLTPELEAVLPFSVVLVNATKKRLVFYAVRWTSTSKDGAVQHDDRMYYNLTTLRGGYAVEPGAHCLVSAVDALNRPPKADEKEEFARKFHQTRIDLDFRKQANLLISLDVAIFADGEVIGPDRSRSLVHAHARLDVAKDLYAEFEDRSSRREPVSLYVTWLKQLIVGSANERGAPLNPWYKHYEKQLARELLRAHEDSGETGLRDCLRQSFRTQLPLRR